VIAQFLDDLPPLSFQIALQRPGEQFPVVAGRDADLVNALPFSEETVNGSPVLACQTL
jgi:hypothetical protein